MDIEREVTTSIKGKKNQGGGGEPRGKGPKIGVIRRTLNSSDGVRGQKPHRLHWRKVLPVKAGPPSYEFP